MGLAHEKKSYLQEKANLFEIGSIDSIISLLLPGNTAFIFTAQQQVTSSGETPGTRCSGKVVPSNAKHFSVNRNGAKSGEN